MKTTINDKHRAMQGQKPEKQSRREAKLDRKRSSEMMSFKFLVKLRRLKQEKQSSRFGVIRVVLSKFFWQGVP
jgi:hypothetical protein